MPVLLVGDKTPVEACRPTEQAANLPSQPFRRERLLRALNRPSVFLPFLTLVSLLVHGYHPYVDDAAIYVAGIEKVIHPSLFPTHAEYVLPHLRHSLFSFALGWLIRSLHVRLSFALFATYLASLWLMLFACWRLTCLLFNRATERWGAMLLITSALTLPVVGSAIFFIDPYLTARSFSTPATILAIAYILERRVLRSTLCLAAAFVLHPLMAAYAIGYVLALVLLRRRSWGWLAALVVPVLALGMLASHAGGLLGSSPEYRAAAVSRSYFFLGHWAWFEVFGLFPPLAAALIYWARRSFQLKSSYSQVSAANLYVGGVAMVFAVFFARTDGSFLLARLQPLRAFQLIYILFFLLLGSALGEYVLRRRWWAWVVCFTAIAGLMFTVQMCTYPSLAHIEWPGVASQNPWERAFLWIRENTPRDALFALDPYYQQQPQEDTIGFRAMAQRSVLADWSKDGGVAAIYPAVAQKWWNQVTTVRNFSAWNDRQRIQALAPYQVSWIVLPRNAVTRFDCPYSNSAVRVCRLPANVQTTAASSVVLPTE
ncbi:MAG TPA: DUF6798 domain-containing protein [Acidobacteriaceae bacterium]|nr:DUF6798 domain-containing protein [Acidobacteriaceae bacterium]